MMRRALWFLGALAGVVLAAGVTYAASSLSTPRVGLSAEPPSAGAGLAPTATTTPKPKPKPKPKPRPKHTVPPRPERTPQPLATRAPAPTTVPVPNPPAAPTVKPTVDDHGGRSGSDDSSGKGRGRDD